jgi:mannose-6-phosphate isomerase-like protein (cupin superfamily)
MTMIRRGEEMAAEVFPNRFGGQGEVVLTRLLAMEQFQGKGRLFARNVIKPGSSIGWHSHKNDFEIYYILSGEGTVDDNGTKAVVKAGDIIYTDAGESHGLENTGTEDLEMLNLVLFV